MIRWWPSGQLIVGLLLITRRVSWDNDKIFLTAS